MSKIVHGQLARWQDTKSWAEGALARHGGGNRWCE